MLVATEDTPCKLNPDFFQDFVMAKSANGRPKAIRVTPEQMDTMASELKQAAIFLSDTAKYCREHDLAEGFVLPAAKMMDEHLPAAISFARKAFAESGPAAAAKALGRKTRIELNQEKYRKRKPGGK